MIKNIIGVTLAVVAAAYSHVALSASPYPGWTPAGLNSNGQMTWFGPGRQTLATASTGNAIWTSAMSGGGAVVNSTANLAMGSAQVAVAVKGTVSAAAVFTTVKAIMGGPVGMAITALTVAPAFIDWLNSGKTRLAPVIPASGQQFETLSPGCSSNCVEWSWRTGNPYYPTQKIACNAYIQALPDWPGYERRQIPWQAYCSPSYFKDGTYYEQSMPGFVDRPVAPYAGVWAPATIDEIRAQMEATPFKPAVVDAILASGGSLPIAYAPGAVTGPASIDSAPVVSKTTSGDLTTTTTTATKTALTYGLGTSPVGGSTVPTVTGTSNTTTNTTVTNNTTGAVTTSNTTVNNPITPPPETEVSSDTPLPGAPKLYKQKYPDGLAGVWRTQRDLMVATPLFTLAKGLMPSVAMSGTCPKMPVNLTFSSWANYGVKDLAPPCQVWDWGRAICIVSALLLARRLIFGG